MTVGVAGVMERLEGGAGLGGREVLDAAAIEALLGEFFGGPEGGARRDNLVPGEKEVES